MLLGVTGSGKTFTMAKVIEASGGPRSSWRTTRPWPRSSITNSNLLSRITRSNISSATTTTTSPKPTFRRATSTSKRKPPSTTSSTSCACPPPIAVRAPRLHHHRQRELHLRPGLARSLLRHAADAGKGPADHARGDLSQAGGDPLRPQRGDFRRGTFRVRGDVIEVYPDLRRLRLPHRTVGR